MTCRETAAMLGDYVLGLLTEDESVAVRQHLRTGCEDCERELDEINKTLGLLVENETIVAPPARVKESLLERLDAQPIAIAASADSLSRSAGAPWQIAGWGPYVAAGIAAVAVGFAAWSWMAEGRAPAADPALVAWQESIASIDRRLGANKLQLVSLPFDRADASYVTHLVCDPLSQELHVWATSESQTGGPVPNHAWFLDADGAVLDHAPLTPRGDYLAAVLNAPSLVATGGANLMLTYERGEPGDKPGGATAERITLLAE